MNVNIEISDITLDGLNFSESQSLELRRALQSELTGLLKSGSLAMSFDKMSGSRNIDCGVIRTGVSTNQSLGQMLSQKIYGAFENEARHAAGDSGGQTT